MENLPQPAAIGGEEGETPDALTASVNTFCEITSASKSEALFYLESHDNSLESAVSTYLEATVSDVATAGNNINPLSQLQSPSPSHSPRSPRSPSYSPRYSPTSPSYDLSRSRSPSPPPSTRLSQYNLRSESAGRANSRRIRTLADLSRRSGLDHRSDSDSETLEPHGGMLVQDPSKANDVDAIFKQVRESGATDAPAEHENPSSSSRSFAGTARLLSGETVSTAPQQDEVVTYNIVFWSNGFSVDDGPLRRLDDPENVSFLESIRKSECPEELQPADRKITVHVNLTRKEGKYPVPKKTRGPFKGVGRTLGATSNSIPEPTDEVTSFTAAPAPSRGLTIDETLPSTSIQLRLADGTRMISRFNNNHTVRDIRAFIDSSRPGGSRIYQLQTVGFPPKVLTNLDETIEEAALGNSVVIQKL